MSFLDIAKKRCSVRSYLPKEVDKEILLQVLEAARIAPSASNAQPWHITVVQDAEIKNKLFEAYPRDWFVKAPVILIFSVDRALSWKSRDGKDFGDIDIAIAADHVTLAAADLGLGTCWLGAFDPVKCRQAVNLSEKLEPVIMMPLGYPEYTASPDRHSTRRKSLEEIIDWK